MAIRSLTSAPRVALFIETSREYGRGLLRGIMRYEREHGPWSIYFKPGGLSEPAPEWLNSWNGDGIIARVTSQAMAETIRRSHVPAIDLWAGIGNLGLPVVGVDNESLSKLAVAHFQERGFRNFAYFGTSDGEHYYYDLRGQAFVKALKKVGFNDCHLYQHPQEDSPPSWEKSRAALAAWLLRLDKPVAIMTCHDDAGFMLLDACHDAGLSVPNDVAVLGINNDELLCELSRPPLSSIDMGADMIGYQTANLLAEMMAGKRDVKPWTLLPPRRLVTRQSTDIVCVKDPHIAQAVKLIREHACRGINVEELLEQIPLSRTALFRRFREQFNCSPKQEFTRVRMEKAKELLILSNIPVADIAEQVGYSESKYFIEVFSKENGMTPLKYRKHHQSLS